MKRGKMEEKEVMEEVREEMGMEVGVEVLGVIGLLIVLIPERKGRSVMTNSTNSGKNLTQS